MAPFSRYTEGLDGVYYFNKYAQFYAYHSMAVNGLGYLVFTWTTVVLLGGFVSTLHRKDFWCLTFITFVQITRITDPNMDEKLGTLASAVFEMIKGVSWSMVVRPSTVVNAFSYVPAVVILVLLSALVLPPVIIYSHGMLISGGISLWRLVEHDYGDVQAPTLEPALDTLYYLAVIQGVLVCCNIFLLYTGNLMLWNLKSKAIGYNDLEREVMNEYLYLTINSCKKDPSSVNERNLITQAVDLIGSKSPTGCFVGVAMMHTAISSVERKVKHWREDSYLFNKNDSIVVLQNVVMKHLVLSASSEHILQKILEMLDVRGPHNSETRRQAAVIVEHLASYINLEQFPRGIQHISSLLGMFQPFHRECLDDEFDQHWVLQYHRRFPSQQGCEEYYGEYKELLLQGMCIFRKLATNENNCRVISDTPDLISKIMVPVTSDLIHHTADDHGEWSNVVLKSLEVIKQLTAAPGDIGAKLRREISSCKEAVSTLHRIFSCNKCNEELQQRAIQILTRLYMDSESNRREFVSMLLDVFTHDTKYSSAIRGYAGCALSQICFHGGSNDAKIVIQTGGGDVDRLTKLLIHENNKIFRQAAAEIVEHLCTHYTKDDNVDYLGKAMKNAMPEVLGEILRWGDETHYGKEADQDRFSKPVPDIESQSEDNDQDKGNNSVFLSRPPNDEQAGEDEKESVRSATFLPSLLSLCGTVYDTTFISDLPPLSDSSLFLNKLRKMVLGEEKIDHPMVENLFLCKAIGKMVISMMKHSGNKFVKHQGLESFIKALSGASKKMQNIDCYMAFRSTTTSSKLNTRTLASFVKEAQELYDMLPSTSVSG